MRYVNLVPEVTPKNKISADKYVRYADSIVKYRNTPERKEFMKNYFAEYRKEHGGLVECDCGSVVKGMSMYNHVKTNKHLNYIQNASG
jgi:hypothetical protein